MDGWEVLKVLKAHDELRNCPVILLTISDDVAKGRALGASGHLVKPVNRDLLLGLLAQVHRPAGRGTLANGKEGEGGSYANEAAA